MFSCLRCIQSQASFWLRRKFSQAEIERIIYICSLMLTKHEAQRCNLCRRKCCKTSHVTNVNYIVKHGAHNSDCKMLQSNVQKLINAMTYCVGKWFLASTIRWENDGRIKKHFSKWIFLHLAFVIADLRRRRRWDVELFSQSHQCLCLSLRRQVMLNKTERG